MSGAWWDNTETWTTREGEVIRLEDLDPHHRDNIIAYIHQHASALRGSMSHRDLLVGLHSMTMPMGELAEEMLLHDLEERDEFVINADDVELVESTPLVKRLRELQPRIIVRIGSHRADAKLKRLQAGIVYLYQRDLKGGNFAEVSELKAADALAITGITKARNQKREEYGVSWGQSQAKISAERLKMLMDMFTR